MPFRYVVPPGVPSIQNVPFAATDFTASAGTWTVIAGNVTTNQLIRIGRVCFWSLNVSGGSLSATPAQIRVAVPFGLVAAVRADNVFYGTPNGLATQSLIAAIVAGGTQLLLVPYAVAWTAGVCNIEGQIIFTV